MDVTQKQIVWKMTLLVLIDAIRLMRVYDVVLWMACRARPLENVQEGPPRITTQRTNVRKWEWGYAVKMNCSTAFVVEEEDNVTTIQFGLQLWSEVINCKTCLVNRIKFNRLYFISYRNISLIFLWKSRNMHLNFAETLQPKYSSHKSSFPNHDREFCR